MSARGIGGGYSVGTVTDITPPDLWGDMGSMTGKQLLDMFVVWMTAAAMSQATIKRRRVSIAGFLRHIAPMSLAHVTAEMVEDWLGTKSAPRTRHAYRSDLSAFFQFLVRRRQLAVDPMVDVTRIRLPRSLPKPIDGPVLHEAIRCAEPRVRLALMLAAYAGLRCGEITALCGGDVTGGYVVVRSGKGNKDRAVPLHPALERELAEHRVAAGVPYIGITSGSLGRAVALHLRSLGINATLHHARHSFGTEAYRVTHDPALVAALMGHSKIDTTMGYVRIAPAGAETIATMWVA